MVRLFEVFTSLEGEGIHYGTKTLFVRLAGCPFGCFYCDTEEALPAESGREYGMEEARRLIDDSLAPNTFKVNFTGGEPLMQHEAVLEMAKHVRSKGVRTYLESSCFDAARFKHVLPEIDIAKIEFKTRDSKFAKDANMMTENAMRCLALAISSGRQAYVKVVASSGTDTLELAMLAQRVADAAQGRLGGFVIQPTYGVAEPSLEQLLGMYDAVHEYYSDVRVVPQLHKAMGAP